MAMREASSLRLSALQSFTIPSKLPDTITFPLELKARVVTSSVCPLSRPRRAPVRLSHRIIVLSDPPLAIVRPSGLQARAHTLDS